MTFKINPDNGHGVGDGAGGSDFEFANLEEIYAHDINRVLEEEKEKGQYVPQKSTEEFDNFHAQFDAWAADYATDFRSLPMRARSIAYKAWCAGFITAQGIKKDKAASKGSQDPINAVKNFVSDPNKATSQTGTIEAFHHIIACLEAINARIKTFEGRLHGLENKPPVYFR